MIRELVKCALVTIELSNFLQTRGFDEGPISVCTYLDVPTGMVAARHYIETMNTMFVVNFIIVYLYAIYSVRRYVLL